MNEFEKVVSVTTREYAGRTIVEVEHGPTGIRCSDDSTQFASVNRTRAVEDLVLALGHEVRRLNNRCIEQEQQIAMTAANTDRSITLSTEGDSKRPGTKGFRTAVIKPAIETRSSQPGNAADAASTQIESRTMEGVTTQIPTGGHVGTDTPTTEQGER